MWLPKGTVIINYWNEFKRNPSCTHDSLHFTWKKLLAIGIVYTTQLNQARRDDNISVRLKHNKQFVSSFHLMRKLIRHTHAYTTKNFFTLFRRTVDIIKTQFVPETPYASFNNCSTRCLIRNENGNRHQNLWPPAPEPRTWTRSRTELVTGEIILL